MDQMIALFKVYGNASADVELGNTVKTNSAKNHLVWETLSVLELAFKRQHCSQNPKCTSNAICARSCFLILVSRRRNESIS